MTTLTEALEKIEPREWTIRNERYPSAYDDRGMATNFEIIQIAKGRCVNTKVKVIDRDTYEKVLSVARELASLIEVHCKCNSLGSDFTICHHCRTEQDCLKILENK